MDFRKIKRLYKETDNELDRLSLMLSEKFGRKLSVTITGDGLCVMTDDYTGVGIEDFEKIISQPGFDIFELDTYL